MPNPESDNVILDVSLPAFELAIEEQLADFFIASMAGTGGPLDGVRVLAAARDFDVLSDSASPPPVDPGAPPSAAEMVRIANAFKPRLTLVGSNYKRETQQDMCGLELVVKVNLKHSTRDVYSRIVNHLRTILSMGIISEFTDLFNAWSTQIGTTGYQLQLQGLVPLPDQGQSGYDDTGLVCRMKFTARGFYVAVV